MSEPLILLPDWYARDVVTVARELLGQTLVRAVRGREIRVMISETEAYHGETDLACHARAGRTPRTDILYGEPGTAYVYFVYGIHWCLNAVCHPVDDPAAVLIRAGIPLGDADWYESTRPAVQPAQWMNGPAKLTRALKIEGKFNGIDLTSKQGDLWIEEGRPISDDEVVTGPRVGIDSVPEPWKSIPWRFRILTPALERQGYN